MSITGEPGGKPVRSGIPIGDLGGGLFAALAVCAALVKRLRTGRGEHIDLSLLDIQVSLLTYVAQYYLADGRVPQPIGSAHQSAVPYQAFATKDGYLVVACFGGEHFWVALCGVLGLPDLVQRYPSNLARVQQRDEVVAILERRFRERTTRDWIAALWEAGVPSGPVSTVDMVMADPQVLHRGMVVEASGPHPVAGAHRLVGNPVKTGARDVFRPAPTLGQHNDELLPPLAGGG
jgi:crotonobetainyl-CoA:carnitine CoA-transferase CaiB-like acyl-CoA transferase